MAAQTKSRSAQQSSKDKAAELWVRADKEWESGHPKLAFRLMLRSAGMGEIGAQVNVGYMYNNAVGTRHDVKAALYWYKRAYRRGEPCAAHNIGAIWRDAGDFGRALYWFNRVVQMRGGDDGEANLEIAKLYLRQRRNRRKAAAFLKRACRSKSITEDALDEASQLLKHASRSLH